MKVVLDTNVLVSGTFWDGDSRKILGLLDEKVIVGVLSQEIIDEYRAVLIRDDIVDKIINKNLIASRVVERIISTSIIVKPKNQLFVVKDDPKDNKVIECAVAAEADYIITKDRDLLRMKKFESITIITPEEFLKRLGK